MAAEAVAQLEALLADDLVGVIRLASGGGTAIRGRRLRRAVWSTVGMIVGGRVFVGHGWLQLGFRLGLGLGAGLRLLWRLRRGGRLLRLSLRLGLRLALRSRFLLVGVAPRNALLVEAITGSCTRWTSRSSTLSSAGGRRGVDPAHVLVDLVRSLPLPPRRAPHRGH